MATRNANSPRAGTQQEATADLRRWLSYLAERDRLAIAREGISLVDELAAISKKLERDQTVLFPRPDGHDIPVVANLFTTRGSVAESIGVTDEDLLARFQEAARKPLPCREVATGHVQDVVHVGNIDLLKLLPIPKHNELDSGPYITAGLLIARNPRTGIQNVAIHRCQVSGPDRIGVLLLPRHTLNYFRMAEEAGDALDIAIVIGIHPVCLLASQAIAALDEDEMEIAGALLGQPIDVVKCKTNTVRVLGSPLTFRSLANLPLILPSKRNGLRLIIDKIAEAEDIELSIRLEVDAFATIEQLVRNSDWVTVLPAIAVGRGLSEGFLRAHRIVAPRVTRQIVCVHNPRRPLSAAARLFVEVITAELVAAAEISRVPGSASSPAGTVET